MKKIYYYQDDDGYKYQQCRMCKNAPIDENCHMTLAWKGGETRFMDCLCISCWDELQTTLEYEECDD